MVILIQDDNPTRIRPYFTWLLIALGVIPSVLLGRVDPPSELTWVPPWATLDTSRVLHRGVGHLLGKNVEDAMGHFRFMAFYLICVIAAVFAQVLPDPASTVPMVGASGAISGRRWAEQRRTSGAFGWGLVVGMLLVPVLKQVDVPSFRRT